MDGLLGEALEVIAAVGNATVPWTDCISDYAEGAAGNGSVATKGKVGGLMWLKTTFDAPADWAAPEVLALDLTSATKGHVYINGFDAGRY